MIVSSSCHNKYDTRDSIDLIPRSTKLTQYNIDICINVLYFKDILLSFRRCIQYIHKLS